MITRDLIFELGSGYIIKTKFHKNEIEIELLKSQNKIGSAHVVTDTIDVGCVTHISIDDDHVDYCLPNKKTLAEMLIKFILKFPYFSRRLEFIFIMDIPENLKSIVKKYHFDNGVDSSLGDEILLRQRDISPINIIKPDGIIFKQHIDDEVLPKLIQFLKENAYWQNHLTPDRLKTLIHYSECYYAFHEENIVGFSRVLTNYTSFASIWDVVVAKSYQNKGIGTALMGEVFSNQLLSSISHWIIYTDTAKRLYERFGFAAKKEIPDNKIVHKLRLQEVQPDYLGELISVTQAGLPISLNETQSYLYLFSEEGKRARLSYFWQGIPNSNKEISHGDVADEKIKTIELT